MKNNKGFSLVELIVVLAIMAVLTGVLAPTLIRNIEKSRKSVCITNMDNLIRMFEAAVADNAPTGYSEVQEVFVEVLESEGGHKESDVDAHTVEISGICRSGGNYICYINPDNYRVNMECTLHGDDMEDDDE